GPSTLNSDAVCALAPRNEGTRETHAVASSTATPHLLYLCPRAARAARIRYWGNAGRPIRFLRVASSGRGYGGGRRLEFATANRSYTLASIQASTGHGRSWPASLAPRRDDVSDARAFISSHASPHVIPTPMSL